MDKSKEKSLNNTYKKFINLATSDELPLVGLKTFVTEDVMGFGTTFDEKILSLKGFLNMLKVQRDQSEGHDVQWEFTPVMRRTAADKNSAVFADDAVLTLIVNQETVKMNIRFTMVFEHINNSWKVVHWHGSKPENTESEIDTFGKDLWKQKKAELEKLVNERTTELLEKNRELEIETALERIRAQAVAMKASSDLLDIVVTMRNEFIKLGHEAHYFWHMMWLPEGYEKAMTSGDGSKIGFVMKLPRHMHGDIPLLAKWEKSKKATVVYTMNADEAIDYVDKMVNLGDFQSIDPQAPSHDDIRHIGGLTFIMARTTHGEIGYSLPGIVKNPPKEDLDILVQFANAFDLAHRRFLDLQKAEEQAREAQIELAIEHVRNRAMTMMKSDELADLIITIFKELQNLDIALTRCLLWIFNTENQSATTWMTNAEDPDHADSYDVPKHNHPAYKSFLKGWKTQQSDWEYLLKGKNKDRWDEILVEGYFKSLPRPVKNAMKAPERVILSGSFNKYGVIQTASLEPISKESKGILERFSQVFEQTYTRFLDLQKAEAQAREAQIETALEKVRSTMMSMHKSSELREVIKTIFLQLQSLNFAADATAVIIYDEDYSAEHWFSGYTKETYPKSYTIPYVKRFKYNTDLVDAWKNKEVYQSFLMKGKPKIEYGKWLLTHTDFKDLPEEFTKHAISPDPLVLNDAFNKYGMLEVLGPEELPEEQTHILNRFSKVFEQTYTRFLDLKKAEAQAREAEIEAALERIRSRSMAMHKTDELSEVIVLLFKQLKLLNLVLDTCFIDIFDQNNQAFNIWIGAETAIYPEQVNLPYFNHPIPQLNKKARQNNLEFFSFNEDEKSKNLYFEHFYKNAKGIEVPKKRKERILNGLGMTGSAALGQNSGITIFNYRKTIYTNEENEILTRVNKVFQQTYIRFLDLQKAEAQAREAQIEASLERVRAKALAMHDTNGLTETVGQLFQELDALDISLLRCGVGRFYKHTRVVDLYTFSGDGKGVPVIGNIELAGHPVLNKAYRSWVKQEEYHAVLKGASLKKYHQTIRPNFKLPRKQNNQLEYGYFLFFPAGVLYTYTEIPLSDEELSIFRKFSSVVGLTYRRYLDLEEAEEQTRTAQINLAVERVRAKALAMHKSEEIIEVVTKLKDEVMGLDIPDVVAATIFLNEGDDKVRMWDLSSLEDDDNYSEVPFDIIFKLKKTDPHLYVKRVWENPENYFVEIQDEKDLKRLMQWLREQNKNEIADEVEEFTEKIQLKRLYHSAKKLNNGKLVIDQLNPPSDEMETILTKMGAAFDLAYKRFEDLKNAEAQAKEALIEAAIERVRSRSMAMHKSSELRDVVNTLHDEFRSLNVNFHVAAIQLLLDETKDSDLWIATDDGLYNDIIHWPYVDIRLLNEMHKARMSKTNFEILLSKSETTEFFDEYFKLDGAPKERKAALSSVELVDIMGFYQRNTGIFLMRYTEGTYSGEEKNITQRFSKVFEQSYTRFLDLQKAEAQAREAQIEGALEKVRSRSLAMHQSEELGDVISEVFLQLEALKIKVDGCFINIYQDENPKDLTFYVAAGGQTYKGRTFIPYGDFSVFNRLIEAREKEERFYAIIMDKEEKDLWWKYFYAKVSNIKVPIKRKNYIKKTHGLAQSVALGEHASIHMMKYVDIPYLEEENQILMRFGKVFDQVYTRFLDLKKAETQAREAQIEASLERVRSKAMAMHSSNDLVTTASQLFKEFQHLDISFIRCGVLRIHESKKAEVYSYSLTKKNEAIAVYGEIKLIGHELMDEVFKHWQLQKDYEYEMKGDAVKRYYQLINKQISIPEIGLKKSHFGYAFYFPEGCLYCFTNKRILEDTLRILRKFNTVMGLTYRRYFELKESEKRELEAIKQSSLDRVRAEIASMRNTKDLERITPLVWKELKALDVPFFRCGVFIIREDERMVHAYLSTPSGESLAALHLSFDSEDVGILQAIITNWRQQKDFYDIWNQEQFTANMSAFMKQGQIESIKKYQAGETAPEKLVLQLVPFKQGMLYAGNSEPLIQEHIDLMKSLAQAFSVAYSRYEDFTQLELAKFKVEDALSELQLTQTQLIQSEKMASLGELTAGIAHEIQNPLNFVNNFSEVSKELLDEMIEELDNGDMEEVRAITDDVIQNLEKINHHGKRADGIVKGMLQHSRSSTGTKEPTNINTLADEYLRLAYHGLRAKDKSFNATLVTDFDDNIGTVNMIPQDIGRVVLNLLTNAFYVVNEKKQLNIDGYEPTVSLTTKKNGNLVSISVKDNGNGIPKHVLEKVFQPFFTTKPTGQGTGLGLSMSYDIVTKGHGGELQVETKKGEGTTFIIELPNN